MNVQPAQLSTMSSSFSASRETEPFVQTKTPAVRQDSLESQSVVSPQAPQRSDSKDLEKAVDRVAQFVSESTSEIDFSIDEQSGVNVVKVIDKTTKEVIRQIPSEEMVALAQALDKLQGLFVRDKA